MCLPSILDFKITLEACRPLWAGHGAADALRNCVRYSSLNCLFTVSLGRKTYNFPSWLMSPTFLVLNSPFSSLQSMVKPRPTENNG